MRRSSKTELKLNIPKCCLNPRYYILEVCREKTFGLEKSEYHCVSSRYEVLDAESTQTCGKQEI